MRDQTDREARRQSDSVGKADERRRVRSRRCVRCVSRDADLGPGELVFFHECREIAGAKQHIEEDVEI